MKKKIICLILSCAMTVGLMAGCGNKVISEADDTASESEATSSEASENSEVAEEPKEVVELKLVMYGTMTDVMDEFFNGVFHDRVLEELQIDLTVEIQPWGSISSTVLTSLQAGESFAFMNMPSSWVSTFIDPGLILELDEARVEESAPNYIAMRAGQGLAAGTANGKLYGLPIGSGAKADDERYLSVRNDILQTVGMDYTDITSVEKLMEACELVHEKYPTMQIWTNPGATYKSIPTAFGTEHYFATAGQGIIATVDELTTDDTVYSWMETEEFEAVCKFNQDLYAKGYISKDILSDSNLILGNWNAGNGLLYVGYNEKIINHTLTGVDGSDQRYLKIGDFPKVKALADGWSFSFATGEEENMDRWYEFFDWCFESKENYYFITYGVEDEHWEYNEYGVAEPNSGERMFQDWFTANLYYDTYPDKDSADVEEYLSKASGYQVLKSSGFSFDKTPVEAIDTAIKAIVSEKVNPIYLGFGDYDAEFPAILEELKEAGLDEYIAEYQKQFSAWYAQQ